MLSTLLNYEPNSRSLRLGTFEGHLCRTCVLSFSYFTYMISLVSTSWNFILKFASQIFCGADC